MALLNFVEKIFPAKPQLPYLAIAIGKNKIAVVVWVIKAKDFNILSQAYAEHDGSWNQIIKAADIAIVEAEDKTSIEKEIEKAVILLPSYFFTPEKTIKSGEKRNIERFVKELSLKPLDFVDTSEVLAKYYHHFEGAPLTAFIVGIEDKNIIISCYKAGKLANRTTTELLENISESLNKILNKLTDVEVFPSRILLYDQDRDLVEFQSQLQNYPWQKQSKFLHLPKVESIPQDRIFEAAIFSTSEKINDKQVMIEDQDQDEMEMTEVPEKFGFVKDEDIAKMEVIKQAEVAKVEQEEISSTIQKKRPSRTTKVLNFWNNFKNTPFFKFDFWQRFSQFNAFKIIFTALVLITIFIIGAFFYFWYPSAKLVLLIDPKVNVESFNFKLNTAISEPDINTLEIPAHLVKADITLKSEAEATGKKKIGEKSHGEVTIYNKTTSVKTFPKGTLLIADNDLKFTLDDEIQVASVSDVVLGTPGTVKANISATDIGEESNLPSKTNFKIEDFPLTSYAARNEEALSGGSSRQVIVVSKEDQQELLASLSANMTKQAKVKLQEKIGNDERLVEETITKEVVEKNFTKEIGEETDRFGLELVVQVQASSYKQSDLMDFVKDHLLKDLPSDYHFDDKSISLQILSVNTQEDKTLLSSKIKMELFPLLDIQKLRKKFLGKDAKEATSIAKEIEHVVGIEYTITRSLPFWRSRFPIKAENFDLAITSR